ncbi:MAG: 3-phosphoshikimate 1-carboxyvinyltransferase [Bacteroidota bacterium]
MPVLVFQPNEPKDHYRWVLPGSKSLSHRYILAQRLYAPECQLKNLSTSTDTQALLQAIEQPENVHFEDGATPLRFFIALAAALSWNSTVDAGARLRERPMKELINCLGLKPLIHFPYTVEAELTPRTLWEVSTSESSQYLSAILLIAPFIHGRGNSCRVHYPSEFPSKPYADMTLKVLEAFGIQQHLNGDILTLTWTDAAAPNEICIEPDWSSAAFAYNICLALNCTEIELPGLRKDSWQGDSGIQDIYAALGVDTSETADGLLLSPAKRNKETPPHLLDLSQMPDSVPAIACAYAFKNERLCLKGIENLVYKESNRIEALMQNFSALGIKNNYTNGQLYIEKYPKVLKSDAHIETFQDHRIAMAFALFAAAKPIHLSEAQSVNKSFPHFWAGLKDLNFDWK